MLTGDVPHAACARCSYSMKTLDDITFATAWVFLPLLPVTHAAGLIAHCPRSAKLRHILLYPFRGGKNHSIFQAIAWVSVWSAQVL